MPGYSNSFMPISDYAKKMYGPNIASSFSPLAPAPQSTLPAGSMTQRGNNLFGSNKELLGTMQNTSFKDTNPSSADRLFNLENFQKARPGVNFSQGDTAFGKTAGMNPFLMGNKPSKLVGVQENILFNSIY